MPRIDQLVEAKRKTKISLKLVVVFDCYFNVGYIILLNKIRPNQLFRRSGAHWQSDQISYFGRSGKDWQYRVPNWYEVVKRLWSLKFFSFLERFQVYMCWDLTSELFRKHILFVSKNGLQILSTFHHSPSVYLNLAARNKVWGSFPFGWVFVSLLLDGSKGVRKGLGLTPPWAWQFKKTLLLGQRRLIVFAYFLLVNQCKHWSHWLYYQFM